jgi:hypothetical protein
MGGREVQRALTVELGVRDVSLLCVSEQDLVRRFHLIDLRLGMSQPLSQVPCFLLASIVPVLIRTGDEPPIGVGTAFCIGTYAHGQALYLTARHVVEAVLEGQQRQEAPYCILLLPGSGGRHRVGVTVSYLSVIEPNCDVALLRADMSTAREPLMCGPRSMRISFERAVVHEQTLALGYPVIEVDAGTLSDASLELRASGGVVEAVYDAGRDGLLSPFPSFQTNSHWPNGMSGAPVLNESGDVIGVVSRGMTLVDAESYGIAAAVAGAAELPVVLRNDAAEAVETSLSAMAEAGALMTAPCTVTLSYEGYRLRLSWPEVQ